MKKILFFVIPAIIFALIIILAYQFFFLRQNVKGALQITSNPRASVYLNGELIGDTPLCKCEAQDMLPVGPYTVKLVPKDRSLSEYEEKIEISPSVLTVVDRKFAAGASSEGSVIFLTPLQDDEATQLLVLSIPEKADVLMDNAAVGATPLSINDVTESDHALRIKKEGYLDKIIRIRTPKGYKLTARVYLGIGGDGVSRSVASPSATPTPTGGPSTVTILDTPTGFLRVRAEATTGAAEIGRVSPGEEYELLAEETGWYQIRLRNGEEGWISAQYAQENE